MVGLLPRRESAEATRATRKTPHRQSRRLRWKRDSVN